MYKITNEVKDGCVVIVALGWRNANDVGFAYCDEHGVDKVYVKVADPKSNTLQSKYILYKHIKDPESGYNFN